MRARRIGMGPVAPNAAEVSCVAPPCEPLRRFTLDIELRPWPDENPFPRLHLLRWWR